MKRRYIILSAFILLCCLATPPNGETCGPYFPEVIFTYPTHPDLPLEKFVRGNVGIVLPTWERRFLVIAYRNMNQHPLAQEEVANLLDSWYVHRDASDASETHGSVKDWAAERAKYPDSNKQMLDDMNSYEYASSGWRKCSDDAFKTAVLTLHDRVKRYGTESQDFRDWLNGQDTVFANCDSDVKLVPAELAPDRKPMLRADRAYQIAAAHFYIGNYDDAAQRFDAIARDNSSQWQYIGNYLVARSLIRKGVTEIEWQPDKLDIPVLQEAERRLQAVLQDPKEKQLHGAAEDMLGYLAYRLHPGPRMRELASVLSGPKPDPRIGQDITDFTWLLDRSAEDATPDFGGKPGTPEYDQKYMKWRQEQFQLSAKANENVDLIDWIRTVQATERPDAVQHAIERWRATRSTTWLVAAMMKVQPDDPATPELLAASATVQKRSSTFLTVTYHRVRLLQARQERKRAREVVDVALRHSDLPPSSRNMFMSQRIALATSLADLAANVGIPAVRDDYYDIDSSVELCWETRGKDPNSETSFDCRKGAYGSQWLENGTPRLDDVGASVLNRRMPLNLLADSALFPKLPTSIREKLLVATWTRAVLLDDPATAKRVESELVKAIPQFKNYAASYDSAATQQDRAFAMQFALLHFPGMRPFVLPGSPRTEPVAKIESFRDNWWCEDAGTALERHPYFEGNVNPDGTLKAYPPPRADFPTFLDESQKTRATRESEQLLKLGPGWHYLASGVLTYAKAHPEDPRIPEALHYAVRSSRYGCGTVKKGPNVSREAFKLLHSRYGNTDWAKKTKYWFDAE